jgi:iron(II)-dependent oxidoreductase
MMGDPNSSKGVNAPMHKVLLSDFYIDQFEVTNQQFAEFLTIQGNQEAEGVTWLDDSATNTEGHLHQVNGAWVPDEGFANHPVVEVTWFGAQAFCTWREARLPTEAEWEKAAKGVLDERSYPWGEGISCDLANYKDCGLNVTVPVDSNPQGVSPYGVYNMSGNASEWTVDWQSKYGEGLAINPSVQVDDSASIKIVRGGSWYSSDAYLKIFHRNTEFRPTVSFSNLGFRCAVTP